MEDAPAPGPRWTRDLLLIAVALATITGLLLVGLHFIAGSMRATLRDDDRYRVELTSITFEPAPPIPPEVFLSEVQYLGELPDRLSVLDTDLTGRLASAFAQHPWVEKVERVEITPSHRAEVRLTYRAAVLAVPWEGRLRAVDRHGILLPLSAATAGLPIFKGQPAPPMGPAGTRWGDAEVETAAGVAR